MSFPYRGRSVASTCSVCERVQLSLLGPVTDYLVNFQKALLESEATRTAIATEALKEVRLVI